jgi:hypothetical protein
VPTKTGLGQSAKQANEAEPILQGAGEALGAQHLGPFVERQIAGEHRSSALVAKTEDLKQHLGSRFR